MTKYLFLPLMFFFSFSIAENIAEDCQVTKIISGNTFLCQQETTTHKSSIKTVQIFNLDTPSKNSPYWEEAKEALSNLILNQVVSIDAHKTEKAITSQVLQFQHVSCSPDPRIGMCVKITNIALAMLEKGMGTVQNYDVHKVAKKMRQPHDYTKAENNARLAKIGLWEILKEQ